MLHSSHRSAVDEAVLSAGRGELANFQGQRTEL